MIDRKDYDEEIKLTDHIISKLQLRKKMLQCIENYLRETEEDVCVYFILDILSGLIVNLTNSIDDPEIENSIRYVSDAARKAYEFS